MPKVVKVGKRYMRKINLNSRGYGINKYMFEELDDIELLCEIGVLSNCSIIGKCRVCRHFLKQCIKILAGRWNYIKYIDFYDALKVISENKELFSSQTNYWERHQNEVNDLLALNNLTRDPLFALSEYKKLFNVSINFNCLIRTYIQSLIIDYPLK